MKCGTPLPSFGICQKYSPLLKGSDNDYRQVLRKFQYSVILLKEQSLGSRLRE